MKQLVYCLLVLLAAGCKERYESPVHSPETGYLVIDGVVNSGPDSTLLTLSRTTKFDNKNLVYETGAQVRLEDANNTLYPLVEKEPGRYRAGNLHLNAAQKYRLRITVTAGKVYLSDYATVNNNPPVDSITWKVENNGVQLYINTHDPLNNTHYYQWYYDEAWEFHSNYLSYLQYYVVHDRVKGDVYHVGYRDSTGFSYNPDIITCWQFNAPTSLFLSSTAKLSEDKIMLPLTYIPPGSIKLGVLYSMHLKQYSWTKDGYAFLEKMKKNTESSGTVFDPQPSELKGNIQCVTDPNEQVIGYFNICPVQEKRIFISKSELPFWKYKSGCYDVIIENVSDSIKLKGLIFMPTEVDHTGPGGGIATFQAAPEYCVDCTLSGSNRKPAYWP
ncbi:MAG: DUF4249 domain-containing protein [Bacteroidota bacterium]